MRRVTGMTSRMWYCYRCGQAFVHARFLAGHLIDTHGEAR